MFKLNSMKFVQALITDEYLFVSFSWGDCYYASCVIVSRISSTVELFVLCECFEGDVWFVPPCIEGGVWD